MIGPGRYDNSGCVLRRLWNGSTKIDDEGEVTALAWIEGGRLYGIRAGVQ